MGKDQKRVLIIGHTGQDGTYLIAGLKKQGCEIAGISRNAVFSNSGRGLPYVNIHNLKEVSDLISQYRPEEIYYLAAYHHAAADRLGEDADLFRRSFETNVFGIINILESVKRSSLKTKVFYAASSHVFGNPNASVQDESTPFTPVCIYGTTKAAGVHACRYYRRAHGVFVSVGILYNHESPLRSARFVTRKIVEAAKAIKAGKQNKLILGDLSAKVDWGYAPDYVDAMFRILRQAEPDDFIIASGQLHSVEEFVACAFGVLGLDWQKYVQEDPRLIFKAVKSNLQGNNEKLRTLTGWQPTVSFEEMIKIMMEAHEDAAR